ncbi:hypothetical protein [Sideroxydans sp. CL21]|uniref:hypothetical protein n=1 Tax=Sideroxydans sp. CL21 TaxID=2600596 RepID=UPI0024BC1B71|nr:hypothetical protein [Sideroxydans sp. CL21]
MRIFQFVLLILLVAFCITAKAADVFSDGHKIYLEGEIRKGDAERFAATLIEMVKTELIPNSLWVSSNGGDINEAMKLVSLIKGTRLHVFVSKGKVCASSCFFVYLAGIERNAQNITNDDGTLLPQEKRDRYYGGVGIHRPYFKDPSGNIESEHNQILLMHKVKSYLEEEGVSEHLIDTMMTHPSNDVYWLNSKDLEDIGEYPPDVEEVAISKCNYIRMQKMYEQKMSKEQFSIIYMCILDNVLDKYDRPRFDYLVKLNTGWRPWKK